MNAFWRTNIPLTYAATIDNMFRVYYRHQLLIELTRNTIAIYIPHDLPRYMVMRRLRQYFAHFNLKFSINTMKDKTLFFTVGTYNFPFVQNESASALQCILKKETHPLAIEQSTNTPLIKDR